MSRRRPRQIERPAIRAVEVYSLPQVEDFTRRAVELPTDLLADTHSSAVLHAERNQDLRRLRNQATRLGNHAMFEIEMRHLDEETAVAEVTASVDKWNHQDDWFRGEL